MMYQIMISGCTGFVGSNITPYLRKEGYTTSGISRTPKSTKEISYNSLSTDIWNQNDVFVHLAGKAHDLKGVSNDNEYFEVNTELTKSLFNQFLKSDCNVFIYMSSVKAAADEVEGILIEEIESNPITAYGKSKLAAENYLLAQQMPKDKKLYILRPCMIHGPGNKGNLNLLYQLVSKGIPYPLGAFDNKRSFLSIENLCYLIGQLIKQRPKSGIYNVADDEAISTNELIKIIGEGSHKKSKIVKLPKPLLIRLGKLGTRLHLPFNEERLQKLTESYEVSNKKIKQVLSISLPISTKEGLIRTVKSFQKNK